MTEENVEQDNVLKFLKEYVDILRSDFLWKTIAPCVPRAEMPAGRASVEDCNGEKIAYFYTKVPPTEYCPMTPVSPRDFACAKLLADTINLLAKYE